MQVIVSHINIDFDGLASIVAAKKLYPKAKMVLPEKLSLPVQQFLAIYRDSLEFYTPKQIDWALVNHLIMVDIANKERLGNYTAKLRTEGIHYTVYDHHQPHDTDIVSDSGNIEFLGATVTMLIEEIQSQHIPISPFEATVMAFGLYTDTGSFTYLGTTPRDLKAAGFLMDQGANLAIVATYSDRPLLEEQQQILNALLLNAIEFQVKGIDVLVSWHRQKEYVGGLASLARKLIDITGSHATFIIVEMAKKVFIIGRSNTDRVDVLPIINRYDGGGHKKAASASVKGGDCIEIVEQVKQMISKTVRSAVVARDMMASPVKAIAPETTIEDATKMILRYGHTGFPVLQDQQLVGIISRRDLDKATHHGLGHAPVKGFMSKEVITIHPETTLEEIQNIMIEHNIGRMPVLENNQLVGIISRTDVVEYLHGNHNKGTDVVNIGEHPVVEINLQHTMNIHIDQAVLQLLRKIGGIADQLGYQAFIIGGIVRDLIMGNQNEDIDIVVEGDGIQFAEILAETFGGTVRGHQKFGTATWKIQEFCVDNRTYCRTGMKFDITTARREYYDYPAALPTVERSSLKEDLYRRDFTINAMAIQINSSSFGKLIDYFHGIQDSKKQRIRVLYNLSFVEDPTRILRAVRFEQRFGFSMDEHTKELAINSVDKILEVSEVRIANELRNLFQEQHPVEGIERLAELGVWDYLIRDGSINATVMNRVRSVRDYLQLVTKDSSDRSWICYMIALFLDCDDWQGRVMKYTLNNDDVAVLAQIQQLQGVWDNEIEKLTLLGELHQALHTYRQEAIVFIVAMKHTQAGDNSGPDIEMRNRVIDYLKKRSVIPTLVTGKLLKEIGIHPGPIYSKIFFQIECAYLNGEVLAQEEAEQWVRNQFSM